MSKVSELKKWVKDEICRYSKLEKFVKVLDESGGPDKLLGGAEHKFKFRIYTETHSYGITAVDRDRDAGYLGCIASTRKPRAGEDWTRGNDLADGPFNRKTWESIKNDIISYELVELEPKIEPIADKEREAIASG